MDSLPPHKSLETRPHGLLLFVAPQPGIVPRNNWCSISIKRMHESSSHSHSNTQSTSRGTWSEGREVSESKGQPCLSAFYTSILLPRAARSHRTFSPQRNTQKKLWLKFPTYILVPIWCWPHPAAMSLEPEQSAKSDVNSLGSLHRLLRLSQRLLHGQHVLLSGKLSSWRPQLSASF